MSCRSHAAELEQFAQDHDDKIQIVGVGSQESLAAAVDFLDDTGLGSLPLLWERSGAFWRLNNIGRNSAIQVASHDLAQLSREFSFNNSGRMTILDAAAVEPWAAS